MFTNFKLCNFYWPFIKLHLHFIILNFYRNSIHWLTFVLLILVTGNLIEVNLLNNNNLDIYSRVTAHNFLSNMLYYYWTNFWFLVPTVSISFLLVICLNVRVVAWGVILPTTVTLLYLLTLSHYWVINTAIFEICSRKENLNLLLTNSINKYHPLLFYISLFALTSLYLKTGRARYKTKIKQINSGAQSLSNALFFLIINLFTLSLGGWWALQEGSWGGWWNWDPSETFGLVVMLCYVLTLHLNLSKTRKKWYWVYVNLFFYIILLLYTLIQLNFDLVSHNFGTRLHQFVNSYYAHCYVLILLSVQSTTLLVNQKAYLNQCNINANIIFVTIILTMLILALLLSAFLDLIVNFVWVLFTVNMFNFGYIRTDLITGLCSIFVVIYYKSSTFYWIPLVFSVVISWVLKLILLPTIYIIKLLNFHKLILSWLYLAVFYINQSVSSWVLFKPLLCVDYYNLKLNTAYTELISLVSKDNYSYEVSWGFLKNTTSYSSLLFIHSLSTNALTQELKSPSLDLAYSITATEPSTSTTMLLLVLTLLYFTKTFNYKPIIKF
jgi:hypothetical protein